MRSSRASFFLSYSRWRPQYKTSDKCAIVYLHGPVGSGMSLGMFENEGEILKGVFLPILQNIQ